jgi:hypothetical protein
MMLTPILEVVTMRYALTVAFALALAACGDDEAAPEEGHHPHSAALFVAGIEVTDALVLPAGETVRVEIKFFDDGGDEITGIEDEHFSALTFDPATLATTADVADHHFQKDVTAGDDIGAGTYTIHYGHDEAADEESFGPYPASVVVTGE